MTYAEFIALYPEFASMSQVIVQDRLTRATALLLSSAWGDFYETAIGLDAAHNLALKSLIGGNAIGGVQAAVGQITSASGAGLSTSFAQAQTNNNTEEWYNKTVYGQEYLRLRSVVIAPCLMAS